MSLNKTRNTQSITILSGVHGHRLGRNWKNGRRRFADSRFYNSDRSSEDEYASLAGRPGHNVGVVDLATLNDAQFLQMTDSNSVIVHGYCFGVADWKLMRRHNIPRATTYMV
jgi:hypothetical protein